MSERPVGSDPGRRALASAAPLRDPQGMAAASGVRTEVPSPRVTVKDRVVVHWLVVACMTGLQVGLGLTAVVSVVYLLWSAIQGGP